MAEFTLCEDWCNAVYAAAMRQDGDSIVIAHTEPGMVHGEDNGEGAAAMDSTYNFTRVDNGLVVRLSYDGQTLKMGNELWVIRPIQRPFGIDLYQRAKMLTHHAREMLKRRAGLTNAQ